MKTRRLADERGASAVEFAIIASLLFMILFGTIQFGLIFNRYQGLQASSREAARLASLKDTELTAIENRAADSLSIVNPASKIPCPAGDPPAFSNAQAGKWCVKVFRREVPGGALTQHTTNNPGPCNAFYTGDSRSVVVRVWLRTRLDIPLWSSPQMTVGGLGEFRCE